MPGTAVVNAPAGVSYTHAVRHREARRSWLAVWLACRCLACKRAPYGPCGWRPRAGHKLPTSRNEEYGLPSVRDLLINFWRLVPPCRRNGGADRAHRALAARGLGVLAFPWWDCSSFRSSREEKIRLPLCSPGRRGGAERISGCGLSDQFSREPAGNHRRGLGRRTGLGCGADPRPPRATAPVNSGFRLYFPDSIMFSAFLASR